MSKINQGAAPTPNVDVVTAQVPKLMAEKQEDILHSEEKDAELNKGVELSVPSSAYSHLSIKETFTTFKRTAACCIAVLFIACSDGFQFSLPGNLNANTSFIAQYGTIPTATGSVALDAQIVGGWNAAYNGAYIVTLLLAGYPCDWFGRKFNMFLLTFLMMVACVVEIVARSWQVWMVAKLLNGASIGLCQMTLTTYVSEVAPSQIRGAMLVAYSFWFAFGQFTAAIATYIIQAGVQEQRAYLRAIYSEWVYSGICLIVILIIPESPRWLMRKGRREKAAASLRRLNSGVPGYDVERELNFIGYELTGDLAVEAENAKVSYWDLFKGVNLRRTAISFSVFGWQQCIGIAVVYGNSAIFFAAAGLSNPFLGTVIINLLTLFVVFTSGYLVERLGRRPLLLTGGAGMIISLLIIGSLGFLPRTPAVGGGTIAIMCIWVLFYTSSAGPCGYLLLGESSATRLRAKTTGFAAACTGLFGLIFSYTTPLMILPTGQNWGVKTAYLFAGTGLIGYVLVYFFVPEHKGRTYAELDELYNARVPARKFRTTQTVVGKAAEISNATA